MERGRGQLRLNDLRVSAENSDEAPQITSRIIMRTVGSLRVILNSKIYPEMTIEKPTDKNIRLTAMDEMVRLSYDFHQINSEKELIKNILIYFCFYSCLLAKNL